METQVGINNSAKFLTLFSKMKYLSKSFFFRNYNLNMTISVLSKFKGQKWCSLWPLQCMLRVSRLTINKGENKIKTQTLLDNTSMVFFPSFVNWCCTLLYSNNITEHNVVNANQLNGFYICSVNYSERFLKVIQTVRKKHVKKFNLFLLSNTILPMLGVSNCGLPILVLKITNFFYFILLFDYLHQDDF